MSGLTDSGRTSRGEGDVWSGGVWSCDATGRDGPVVDSIIEGYVDRAPPSASHGERGRQHHTLVTGMTDHGVVTAQLSQAPDGLRPQVIRHVRRPSVGGPRGHRGQIDGVSAMAMPMRIT